MFVLNLQELVVDLGLNTMKKKGRANEYTPPALSLRVNARLYNSVSRDTSALTAFGFHAQGGGTALAQEKLGRRAKGGARGVGTAQRPAFLPTRWVRFLHTNDQPPCRLLLYCLKRRREKVLVHTQ